MVGAATIIAYFLVIHPKGNAPVVDIVLAFSFALFFIAGGILVFLKNTLAIYLLIAACIFYAIAGLYNPIRLYGFEGIYRVNPQFYFSLCLRCILAFVVFVVMRRQGIAHARAST